MNVLLAIVCAISGGAACQDASESGPGATIPRASKAALEQFVFRDTQEKPQDVQGRVVVTAADGGILIEDRAGALWTITPDRLSSRTSLDRQFSLYSLDEHQPLLRNELGPGFRLHKTRRYVIVSDAGEGFVEWVGALLDRFHAGFFRYWEETGLRLSPPAHRLIVIIFRDKEAFTKFQSQDSGSRTQSPFGYYSIRRNRVVLHNFTGLNEDKQTMSSITRAARKLPFEAATIVHEAAHQLSFNSGLQTRYADNPVWLTEGLAMCLEKPDLKRAGWSTAGQRAKWRVKAWKSHSAGHDATSLQSLTSSDDRFRSAETAPQAYSEAWGLTQYLLGRQREKFIEYLKAVAAKPPMVWDKPEQRRDLFSKHLGDFEEVSKQVRAHLKR